MSVLKKLASQTAVYGLSSMIGRALNYLLVPYYTSVFIPEEYGVVNELYAYVAFFNVLFTFGMETTYFRFANKEGGDEQQAFNHALSFIVLVSVIGSGSLFLFSQSIANLVEYPESAAFVKWLALVIAIDAVVAIPFARLRMQNKAKTFAALRLINISLNIGLNIFFISLCKGINEGEIDTSLKFLGELYSPEIGVGYVFLSNLIANSIFIPLLFKSFLKWRFKLQKEQLKPMFQYAYPLMFMGLAYNINEVIDRPLLKFLWNEDKFSINGRAAIGIYGASYKIATLLTLGIQAMRYAVEPFVFSHEKEKDSADTFARIMSWFIIIALFIFLFLSLNINWIGPIAARKESYHEGFIVVPILLMANLFLGIYSNLSLWYKLSDRTQWGTYLSLFGAAITLIGNFLLIPRIGYMGSAWTTLACYFSMAALSYIMGQKYYPVPYKLTKNLVYIIISLGVYFGISQLELTGVLMYAINGVVPFIVVGAIFVVDKREFIGAR